MKKKICHVFFDEYPKDSRIRRYTNALIENDFEVFIISLNDGTFKFFENKNSIKIFRIPLKKKRGTFIRRIWEYFIFQLYATLLTAFVFIRFRVKLFHVSTLPDFLVFSCFIPKLFNSKIILDFHELFPEFMMQHKPGLTYDSFLIKIILLQERLSYKFADRVIVFHDPASEILKKRIFDDDKSTTIMNGVDKSELPNFVKKKTDNFRIIYNGTINFNLNLSLCVKALNLIKNKDYEIYKNIGFYLYGDGPDLNNILDVAKELDVENVYYIGRLKFADMIKELELASACILPPKKDIYSDLYYSLKLTEMIYFKIPVIATRLNTYLYYYPEDSLIYFDSENIEELAEKIIYIYNNGNNLGLYTENAFNYYQKNNWEIMKERYLNLVNSFQF